MKHFTLLVLSASLLCSSCYHVYYAPNTPNTPLLSEKGEGRLNGLIATGMESEFVGLELQSAYAVRRNWGLMLNFFAANKSENTGSYVETGRGSYVEAATGFFAPVSSDKKWIAELYAGVGAGTVTNEYGYMDESRVGITKFFLQPSFGYKSKFIEFAVVPRLSRVNMQVKHQRFSSSENEYEKRDIDALTATPEMFAFEPALIFRGGGEAIKVQVALSFCNTSAFLYTQPNETLNASFGVAISLRPKKKN
jgi:hypothetical protein